MQFVLKKCLYRDQKSVSFAVVDSGKPIHVAKVQNHPGVHLWNPARRESVIDLTLYCNFFLVNRFYKLL